MGASSQPAGTRWVSAARIVASDASHTWKNRPLRHRPSVDRVGGAVDVARLLAAQKGDERGDLLRPSIAADRDPTDDPRARRLRVSLVEALLDLLHHRCVDGPRADRVDANAVTDE